ncbi:MAG: hypothetical protein QN203_06935 [Armatimonadota bacterium]|nr:hypothetical protein [Armatimonadota bacterium]MDR7486746.1 hypothetical protein [Armatimonadota bacterium]
MVWLALLSAVTVVVFAAVLIAYLIGIVRTLDAIGGSPTSYLAKIRMGVRAIETETGMLAPQVTRFNEGASALLSGLKAVAGHLDATARALGGRS